VVDITSEGKRIDLTTLHDIHTRKTGAMIRVSVRTGAILAGASAETLQSLTDYGDYVGLAFQITDDVLDVEGDREQLGKETGADRSRRKATFPALIGVEASREKTRELVAMALGAIDSLDEKADPLRLIAGFIGERKK